MNRLLYLALRSPQRELRGWAVRALRELARQPLARPVLLHAGALEALALAQATLASPPRAALPRRGRGGRGGARPSSRPGPARVVAPRLGVAGA